MSPRRSNRPRIYVDRHTPPVDGRFLVFVAGYMEWWTIDEIERAVTRGADVREWER